MRRWLPWLVLGGVLGCAPPARPELAWTFEARPTAGEIRVVPLIGLYETPAVSLTTFVGRDLPWENRAVRLERTRQLAAVPDALGLELPGAVNGVLGGTWEGQFRSGGFPYRGEDRIRSALAGPSSSRSEKRRLDDTLARVARRTGADATLFTWVERIDGRPVSADGFPGAVVETSCGPVLVDHEDEPYLVQATIGMALVTGDGEVVLRYADSYEAVLSGQSGPERAARDLARGMAMELAKVWATDPRLVEPVRGEGGGLDEVLDPLARR